jgi:3',5'-cyclic AMP phosphodiesterase CpdA
MASGSPQDQWLRADLAVATNSCILAYWHHPLFSSGTHGNDPRSADAWRTLRSFGVDVIVNGHDHVYERFAPQSPDGFPDPRGIRQFTVGTGGAPLYTFGAARPASEVRLNVSFGVL